MKIAIMSMQEVINYGSVLQAYSLCEIISEIAPQAEIEFVKYDSNKILTLEANFDKIDFVKKIKWNPKLALTYFLALQHRKKMVSKIITFQVEVLKKDCYTKKENYYDMVFVGSDEVFKAQTNLKLELYGDISFARNKFTYAACSGQSNINILSDSQKLIVQKAMKNYQTMSVRDDATKNYVTNLYEGEIQVHLDPVLVGNLRRRKAERKIEHRYILVYAYGQRIRSKEEISMIKKFAKKQKCKLYCVFGPQIFTRNFLTPSPIELLDLFAYAEYVITDTFHGAIFSIINKCKFIVFCRFSNNNKLVGMLNLLNLMDRIYDPKQDFDNQIIKPINYDCVFSILDEQEMNTREYLTQCIEMSE